MTAVVPHYALSGGTMISLGAEDSRRARELFSRKVLGSSPATDAPGVLVSTRRYAGPRGDQFSTADER